MQTHLAPTIRPTTHGYGPKTSSPRNDSTALQDDFMTRGGSHEQNGQTKDQYKQDTKEGIDAKRPLDQLPGTDADDALNTINDVQQKCIETIVKEDLLSTLPGMDVDDALETINDVQQKCIETIVKEDLLNTLPGMDVDDALETIDDVQQKCIETIVNEDLLNTLPGMDVDDALETIDDIQQKCIKTVVEEDLLGKLPGMDAVDNALETISDVQQKCIETVVTVVNTVTRVSLMSHITALRDLTNGLIDRHPDWEQSRILSELRSVDHGSDDDSIWGAGTPIDGESSGMTVDEQNQYRKIRQDMIEQAEFDIGRVLLTMDNRRHTDEVFDSLPTLSKNLGTLMKTTFNAINTIRLMIEIPDKAELMGKIDGTNIANRMERGHEMDALFDYYLGEGQHCDNITIRDRFTAYEADQRMYIGKWAMSIGTAKLVDDFFNKKSLQEDQEALEENKPDQDELISSQAMKNRIDQSVENNSLMK